MMDPSKPSGRYQYMADKWHLPMTLMQGSQAMQKAGQRYLPRHPAENDRIYQERARKTILRNYFRRTVHKLVGQVFGDPFIFENAIPETLVNLLRDVDLTGRGLTSFAQSWFEDAIVCGLSHILVDFPAITQDQRLELSGLTTRPYAVHIPAHRLISWQWEMGLEGPHLKEIRILEEQTETGQGQEKAVQMVRLLKPDHWCLFRRREEKQWEKVEEGENSLGVIPLVTLYTNRTGFMEAVPPLEDLAWLNLEHYQIRSDQRNALNVASFPILAASGYNPEIDGPIEVGPNKVLTTSDTEGKYYYVESTGAALEAGARELADLEKTIQLFGLQFEARAGKETATGRLIDAAEANAPVASMVNQLEDALNKMLSVFARWGGIEVAGKIVMKRPSSVLDPELP